MPTMLFIIDPVGSFNAKKDSSLVLIESARDNGFQVGFLEPHEMSDRGRELLGHVHWLSDDTILEPKVLAKLPGTWEDLFEIDVVMMRKDPPVDAIYIACTWQLSRLARAGVWVINSPQALRDYNEKYRILDFPDCTAPTMVSAEYSELQSFIRERDATILKPLDGMGGASIFKVSANDPNVNVILETLTLYGTRLIMAQAFIPAVTAGDKRIILIDGEPIGQALVRLAAPGETRSNLAAGASWQVAPLSERDRWLCAQVGPEMKKRGCFLVGLDVIGDFITEINITSPTCLRELTEGSGIAVADQVISAIENGLKNR